MIAAPLNKVGGIHAISMSQADRLGTTLSETIFCCCATVFSKKFHNVSSFMILNFTLLFEKVKIKRLFFLAI